MKNPEFKNLLDAIVEGRSVRFSAVSIAARTRPMFKCAIINGRGETLTGSEKLFEEPWTNHPIKKRAEKIKDAALKLLVLDEKATEKNDGESTPSIQIDHGMVLDLSKDQDAALLLFSILDGSVASTKSAVNKVQHFFYVEDKKAEAGVKLQAMNNKAKALEFVKAIKPNMFDAYVALLGLYARPEQVASSDKELALYELADSKPAEIIRLFEDKSLDWKLILQQFVNTGVVNFNTHKKEYTVQGNLIGTTFSEALSFIMDDKNQAVVNEWRKGVTGKTVSA